MLSSSRLTAFAEAHERERDLLATGEWPFAPEPLRRDLPAPRDFPVAALGDLLGDAAKAIHDSTEAPMALCGSSVLVAASLAVQAHGDLKAPWGDVQMTNLWMLTVADSGERKTTVDGLALKAHREHERVLHCQYTEAHREYLDALKTYQAQQPDGRKRKGTASTGNLANLILQQPIPPLRALVTMGEPSLEGLQKHLLDGLPSIGVFSDEGGQFFGGYSMNKDNRQGATAGYSQLWDSGDIKRVRGGDGTRVATGKRVALHLMMQPVIAERVMGDDLFQRQGFLARFLVCWPQSTMGTRLKRTTGVADDPLYQRYLQTMKVALERSAVMREDSELQNELAPRTLTLSTDATNVIWDFRDSLETKLTGEYKEIAGFAAKSAAQALRIAAVMTLVDDLEAQEVDVGTMRNGVAIAAYYLGESKRLVEAYAIPQDIRDAELLLDWMRSSGKTILTADDMQRCPNRIRTKAKLKQAAKVLVDHHYLREIENGMADGKMRRQYWQLRDDLP